MSNTVCPECGEEFDPDWLYSVDYAHAFQWTPRRKAIAWIIGIAFSVAIIIFAAHAGAEYVCMLFSVLGIGAIFLMRRLIQ